MRLRLNRLFSYPRVRLLSRGASETTLSIDGIVCDDVCAVRARDALRSLPGVTDAVVDYEAGTATVTGAQADLDTYQRAIDGVVSGKGIRRLLERIGPHRHAGDTPGDDE